MVLAECKPKAKIVDICEKGDAFIKELVFIFIFIKMSLLSYYVCVLKKKASSEHVQECQEED